MKYWTWVPDGGEKPHQSNYEGRSEQEAAISYVRHRRSYLGDYRDETIVRVDDELGHRFEMRVRVIQDVRFVVDSVDE